MNRIFAILLIITGIAFSCVSVKKLNYLQDEQAYRADYATDSVLARYHLQLRKYVLKPEDIISLRIGSLTPREYDFVKQYEERLGEIRRLKQYSQGQQDQQGQMMRQGFGGFGGQGLEDAGLQAIALDRFNTGFILDRKGNLPLPNIGEVHLAGLTLAEAEVLIENQLEGYFETPEVRIQLLSFQFTILGEVKQEGRYTTFKPESHIFDAITLAGNLTDFADRSRIKIVRQQNGIADVRYINLLKEDLLDNANYFLQPDDLIVVPALQARTWQRYVFPVSATTLSLVTAAVSLVLIFTTLN